MADERRSHRREPQRRDRTPSTGIWSSRSNRLAGFGKLREEGALLVRLRSRWKDIRLDLVTELDRAFGIYEIVNGRAHWRKQRFADYVRHHRMSWPTYANGTLDETDETFRARKYPHIEPLRELRHSLSKLRLNDLVVGHDHRNRAPLWPSAPRPAATHQARRSTCSGRPSGRGS